MNHPTQERRSRERITLQCPVEIFVTNSPEIQHASVVNLSSRGVYFLSDMAFAPGEYLQCRIEITPSGYRTSGGMVCLDCALEVVRIEKRSSGYGVGCRIERYMLHRVKSGEMARPSAARPAEETVA